MPSILKGRGRKSGRRRAWAWFLEFLLTAVLMWMGLMFAGRQLPKIALEQISELTNTKIEAGAVDFRFDGSVNISDFAIWPKVSADYDNSILKAETVRVHFRVVSLLTFRPRVKEIFVDDFVLRALYDSDKGQWNLSALKVEMPQGVAGRLPRVWFENGTVEYCRMSAGRVRIIESLPVSAGLRPAEKIMGGYNFDISSAGRQSFEKSVIVGDWLPGRIIVGGRINSKDVPGFERPWTIKMLNAEMVYEPNKAYVLKAKVKDLSGPPSYKRNLFSFDTKSVAKKAPFVNALQEFFNKYGPSGSIDMDLQVSGNLARLSKSRIAGTVHCTDAAVCDQEFVYPVEHITGRIGLTEKSVRLVDLTGRHGDVELAFAGWVSDFGANWKYQLQVTSENMLLDEDLYNALGRDAKRFWTAFSPKGSVAVNLSRTRLSPTQKQTALAVELLDVEAKYAKFEYPLKHTRGKLFFGDGSIEFSDVTSRWGGRKITINGIAGFGRAVKTTYDVLIKGQRIPLDSTLEESLPAAQRDIYSHFEMSGFIDATIRVFNKVAGDGSATFTAKVFPRGSSIRPKSLPIVVSDVTGKIIFGPDEVDIENLTGRYRQGTVDFSGRFWPVVGQGGPDYCLSMQARRIELNDELVGAMPVSLGKTVAQLHPGGEVNLMADVGGGRDVNCLDNRLVIECLGNTIDCNLLPYPLRDISGRITVSKTQIEFEDITARASHRVRAEPVESAMRMAGKVILGQQQDADQRIKVTAGDVNFSGQNVRFKGKTLAKLDMDLVYDPESNSWLSKYFVADFYDGKMMGKLQLSSSRTAGSNKSDGRGLSYIIEASVTGADLKKFLSDRPDEIRPEEHYSTGTMNGSFSIAGSIVDSSIRLGRCWLKIIDMEVGKLSPLAKLLTVLNLNEPSDYAFDQMVVDAYIQDNDVFLRKIDLSGRSVAFYGAGRLNLKTDDINLTLTARGRRLAAKSPSILQSLVEGLGRAVVRIDVTGKADDPLITTTPLPVIKETLGILGTPRKD